MKLPVLSDAIRYGKSVEIVRLLLAYGADINGNAMAYNGDDASVSSSMISYAICDAKNEEMVRLLLEHGADANGYRIYRNQYGCTRYSALSDAIWNIKSVKIVKVLLEYGANASEQIIGYYDDGTPMDKSLLSYAICDAKNEEMVRLLLEHGADVTGYRLYTNQYGKVKYPAMSDAICQAKNFNIIKLLLEYGADVNQEYSSSTKKECCSNGNDIISPIFESIVFANDVTIFKVLMEAGANLDKEVKYHKLNKSYKLKKFPFKKILSVAAFEKFEGHLKEYGWKASWF